MPAEPSHADSGAPPAGRRAGLLAKAEISKLSFGSVLHEQEIDPRHTKRCHTTLGLTDMPLHYP